VAAVAVGRTAAAPGAGLRVLLGAGRDDSAIVADDEDYWQVDDEARLAYAVGVAVDPTTSNAVNLLGPVLASYAEQHEQFQRGGRYLELGCGAAGMCTTILQIYLALEAVGIELSDCSRPRPTSEPRRWGWPTGSP
jgi:hypothetical protein